MATTRSERILMMPKICLGTPMGNFHYMACLLGSKCRCHLSMRHDRYFLWHAPWVSRKLCWRYHCEISGGQSTCRWSKECLFTCRQYSLRMNSLKCAFSVFSRKFLGFTIHQEGSTKSKLFETWTLPKRSSNWNAFKEESLIVIGSFWHWQSSWSPFKSS